MIVAFSSPMRPTTHLTSPLRFALLAALGHGLAGCGGSTGGEGEPIVVTGGTGGTDGGGMNGGAAGAMHARAPRLCVPRADVAVQEPFTRCAEGWVHRVNDEACPYAPSDLPALYPPETPRTCESDLDCTEKEFGYCAYQSLVGLRCLYGCGSDAECALGQICKCASRAGVCVSATCATDADCGDRLCLGTLESTCSPSPEVYWTFACDDPKHECIQSSECGTGQECEKSDSGNRCQVRSEVACGRPFLIDGLARRAALLEGGSGWNAVVKVDLESPDTAERRELAEHWIQMGLMEHASVAAFGRFALELLALQAPAELLKQTQQAMGDEIAHAEICFGIASAYAGRPLTPGPIALDGALGQSSREAILGTAFLEACVGECVAAVEARLASELCNDPGVRAALDRIAADESRHAELGWRVLQWGLEGMSGDERRRFTAELAEILDREIDRAVLEPSVDGRALTRFGVPTDSDRSCLRRAALEEIVVPCARALGVRLRSQCPETTSSTPVVSGRDVLARAL